MRRQKFSFRRVKSLPGKALGVAVVLTLLLGMVAPCAAANRDTVDRGSVRGLRLSFNGNVLTIGPGQCRNDRDGAFIILDEGETITINPQAVGVNGVDVALQPNQNYAVYIMKSGQHLAGLLSLSFDGTAPYPTGPLFPPGYERHHRRIGSVLMDGTGDIRLFVQAGTENRRTYTWVSSLVARQILPGGDMTVFTSVSHAEFVPPNATSAGYFVEHISSGGSKAELRPSVIGGPAHVWFSTEGIVWLPTLGATTIHYRNSKPGGLTNLFAVGYEEEI